MTKIDASPELKLMVKLIVAAWDTQNVRLKKHVDSLSDEQLMMETAPTRNRGIYLVGHLTAISDAMLPLLGWGERLYPQFDAVFVKSPDKSGTEMPPIAEIRKSIDKVTAEISAHIGKMKAEDWLAKHNAVSAEDFAREPHRNKMSVLISRTNHLSYHLGQLIYLGRN